MKETLRTLTRGAALCIAGLALTGCTQAGEEATPVSEPATSGPIVPNTTDTGTTFTDSTIMGNDPSTWAPVLVDPGTKTVTLVKGQTAAFPDYEYNAKPNETYALQSSTDGVIQRIPEEDSFVPSFRAADAGTTNVSVLKYDGDPTTAKPKVVTEIEVTVQ